MQPIACFAKPGLSGVSLTTQTYWFYGHEPQRSASLYPQPSYITSNLNWPHLKMVLSCEKCVYSYNYKKNRHAFRVKKNVVNRHFNFFFLSRYDILNKIGVENMSAHFVEIRGLVGFGFGWLSKFSDWP